MLLALDTCFEPEAGIRCGRSRGIVLRAAPVTLTIYDTAGRVVRTLLHGQRPAGRHELGWDGRNASGHALSSGVYFLRLTHPGAAAETKALTLLR